MNTRNQSSHSDLARRACPVCDSLGQRSRLHHQRFEAGLLGDGYHVSICGQCGCGFADGIPPQNELDRYYAERSKYAMQGAMGAESPYDMKRFELIVRQLGPLLPSKDISILDIGCATGGLLGAFKQQGFRNVLGTDPSAECAAAARRLHGVEAKPATLEILAGWTEKFDLILMTGVLEHLGDVANAVKIVANLLGPNGLLYVAVPDVERLADVRNAPYQQFSMEHVNFFSWLSLQRLLARVDCSLHQSWKDIVEWRAGVTEPELGVLFSIAGEITSPKYDDLTEPALRRYLDHSAKEDASIHRRIDRFVQTQEPILIWGAGALTRRLLAETNLRRANIVAFIDANSHLQGQLLVNRPILRPSDLGGRTETILIGSITFEGEIAHAVRHELKLLNPLATLSGERLEDVG